MNRAAIAIDHMPRVRLSSPADPAHPRAGAQAGFTLIEVLVTIVVLTIGLLGTFAALRSSAHTTLTNRERQAETSLAREALEDVGSLPIAKLTTAALPSALHTMMPGASLDGAGNLQVTRAHVTYLVSPLTACSVDDPSDGYGSHTNPAQWCSNPSPSSPPDPTPDNQERVSLTVQPTAGVSGPAVQQSTLIANRPPVLTGVSPGTGCVSGPPVTCTGGQALTFSVATSTSATSYRWFVNGAPQAATTSQLTWTPTNPSTTAGYTATYTISAQAEYGQGPWSPASTLQIKVTF